MTLPRFTISPFHPIPVSVFHCCSVLFILLSSSLYAQLDAGRDDTINPGVPVTLTATYGLIGNGITISEDGVEGPFPIGFSFSFFGEKYTSFYVGANGWISFIPNLNSKGIREAFAIPSAADYNPKACILGPFQDLNPLSAGSPYIFYRTIGDSADRKLLVMWCQTPMYSCEGTPVTFQIILYEKNNIVENHIYQKPECPDWLGNRATLGIQNISGFRGFPVPGRNATSWAVSPDDPEGWQYRPTSADSFQVSSIPYNLYPLTPGEKISYRWYKGPDIIAENSTVVVAPGETTTYVAWARVCNGQEFTDTVTVYVFPNIPNAFTPNGDGLNDDFRILGVPPENITRFNMQVFNRWGQMVFSSNDILKPWDGKLNGEVCDVGMYSWVIYYEDNNKTKVSNKGTVMLIH
jgi:gliding motility-associated-like protein